MNWTLFVVLLTAILTAVLVGKPGAWKKIAAIAIILYPVLIVGNILAYWWVFNKIDDMLLTAGWDIDPYLRKAAVSLLSLLVYAGIPLVLKSLIKANSWKTAMSIGIAYFVMNLLFFGVSRPAASQVSNPNTGASLYKYFRDTQKNCVERFPAHYEFHPTRFKTRLSESDEKIVEEWKQRPCEQEQPVDKPAGTSTTQGQKPLESLSNAQGNPDHRKAFEDLHFSFESCLRGNAVVNCTFTIINDSIKQVTANFHSNIFAVDSLGNIRRASHRDVGGEWAETSFLGFNKHDCQDCDFEDVLLSPGVVVRLHVAFSDVPAAIDSFQYIRITFCCEGILNNSQDLDFHTLSLSLPALPAAPTPPPPPKLVTINSAEDEDYGLKFELQFCHPDSSGLVCRIDISNTSEQEDQLRFPKGSLLFANGKDPGHSCSALVNTNQALYEDADLSKEVFVAFASAQKRTVDLSYAGCPSESSILRRVSLTYQVSRNSFTDSVVKRVSFRDIALTE